MYASKWRIGMRRSTSMLWCPNITDQDKTFEVLEDIANKVDQINTGDKHYFIHIEECDQFANDPERMERIFQKLFESYRNNKVHLTFSTSRPAPEIISNWLLELTDLKIIFKLATPEDYITVADEDFSNIMKDLQGTKIACLRDEFTEILPLTVDEVISAEKFRL
jgi:hypothetical protein